MQKHLQKSPYGFITMDQQDFEKAPPEIRIRTLNYMLNLFKQTNTPLSLESIEKIALNMPKYATLAGCQWVISHCKIFVAPELKVLMQAKIPANSWTTWGGIQIFTNKSFTTKAAAPVPRHKNIPYLIQRTFLKPPQTYKLMLINTEKELEKKIKKDYKDSKPFVILKFNQQKDNK